MLKLMDLSGFITPFSLLCVSEIKILVNTCVWIHTHLPNFPSYLISLHTVIGNFSCNVNEFLFLYLFWEHILIVKECSMGRKRPMVGGGGQRGKANIYGRLGSLKTWKTAHFTNCPGWCYLRTVTMGLGSSVEKLSGHLFSASLIAGAFIFAVIHLCFLNQPAWVLEAKVVLLWDMNFRSLWASPPAISVDPVFKFMVLFFSLIPRTWSQPPTDLEDLTSYPSCIEPF